VIDSARSATVSGEGWFAWLAAFCWSLKGFAAKTDGVVAGNLVKATAIVGLSL
jgi:hypothetical protein